VSLLRINRAKTIANAVISDPEDHTTMDSSGAVRSIQAADVDMPIDDLSKIWSGTDLERLARTYWWYLSRISLGLIRVHYGEQERAVVFLTRPFVLLRFHAPEYTLTENRGIVRWWIRDGLLVAKRDDGFLEIDVRRCPSEHEGYERAHVEVEVASFYPRLARPFKWFYVNTQSRIHVIVTHGFLKRLARMELEESAIGRFADDRPDREPEDVTIGSTPWTAVAVLVAVFAGLGALVHWALKRD
jgi:hypothetical protein